MIIDIVKDSLDRSIESIAKSQRLSRRKAIKRAGECLAQFSDQWSSGEAPTLNYNEPLRRWAYCYAQVPANADLLSTILLDFCTQSEGFKHKVLKSDSLTVCAIGGGPGTEILGFTKLLRNYGSFGQGKELYINVLDQESGWAENLVRLTDSVKKTIKSTYKKPTNFPFFLSCNHFPINIHDAEAFSQYSDAINSDLVTCSYFLSEIFDLECVEPLVEAIKIAASNTPLYLLIVDRSDIRTLGTISRFMDLIGAKQVVRKRFDGSLESDEQTSTLSEYNIIMNRVPRIRWKAVAILAKIEAST